MGSESGEGEVRGAFVRVSVSIPPDAGTTHDVARVIDPVQRMRASRFRAGRRQLHARRALGANHSWSRAGVSTNDLWARLEKLYPSP